MCKVSGQSKEVALGCRTKNCQLSRGNWNPRNLVSTRWRLRTERVFTSRTCQFLGHKLISWFNKKQHSVARSTVEVEYVVVGSCCTQMLWFKQQLRDYNVKVEAVPIFCDNNSAIAITQYPVHHSRTKHIDIRHHFIGYHVEKKNVSISYVGTNIQLADMFTKPLQDVRFKKLCLQLGLLELEETTHEYKKDKLSWKTQSPRKIKPRSKQVVVFQIGGKFWGNENLDEWGHVIWRAEI